MISKDTRIFACIELRKANAICTKYIGEVLDGLPEDIAYTEIKLELRESGLLLVSTGDKDTFKIVTYPEAFEIATGLNELLRNVKELTGESKEE